MLREAVAGDRLEALVVVALGLGLRQGEALGLRWSDVDLDRQQVVVHTALQRVKGAGLQLVPVKTDLSRRVLPLPAIVADALRVQQERQALDRMVAGRRWAGNGVRVHDGGGYPEWFLARDVTRPVTCRASPDNGGREKMTPSMCFP